MNLLWRWTRPLLFVLDPERAHRLALCALKTCFMRGKNFHDKRLHISVAGLNFSNPLGLAAGFDKNGEAASGLLKLGFGHIEIGTVTPHPQAGNVKPRLFRLTQDQAIINRMGFNNKGHYILHQRLKNYTERSGLIGLNIGANKDSIDRIADYTQAIKFFYNQIDYFTVNISSPNTPGLRDLQGRENLEILLKQLQIAREDAKKNNNRHVPIFFKIAPDLTESQLDDIAATVINYGCDGLVISNTTLSRSGLTSQLASEVGGLSGKPIFDLSTIILAKMRVRLGKDFVLIGVGGVDNGENALEKIRAGADLVQIYSSIIFNGPHIVEKILNELTYFCDRDGQHISDYRDQHVKQWASRSLIA